MAKSSEYPHPAIGLVEQAEKRGIVVSFKQVVKKMNEPQWMGIHGGKAAQAEVKRLEALYPVEAEQLQGLSLWVRLVVLGDIENKPQSQELPSENLLPSQVYGGQYHGMGE